MKYYPVVTKILLPEDKDFLNKLNDYGYVHKDGESLQIKISENKEAAEFVKNLSSLDWACGNVLGIDFSGDDEEMGDILIDYISVLFNLQDAIQKEKNVEVDIE